MGANDIASACSTRPPLSWGMPSRWERYPDLKAYRESGDRRALNRVLKAHDPLLRHFARQFWQHHRNLHPEWEDCHSAAQVGMWKACDRYDPSRGAFSQAVYWSVRDSLASLYKRLLREAKMRNKLRLTHGFQRTSDEIGNYTPEWVEDNSTLPEFTTAESGMRSFTPEDEILLRERFLAACKSARLAPDESAYIGVLLSGFEPKDAAKFTGVRAPRAAVVTAKLARAWDRSR